MVYKYGNKILNEYYNMELYDNENTNISLCHDDYSEAFPTIYGTQKIIHVDNGGDGNGDSSGDSCCECITGLICIGAGCVACSNCESICQVITNCICGC